MLIFETEASDYAAEFVNTNAGKEGTNFVVLGFTDFDNREVGTVMLETTDIHLAATHYSQLMDSIPFMYDDYKLALESN